MKKTILVFCALLMPWMVMAQDEGEWKQHRHSVELTTGFPSLPGAAFPPGSGSNANHRAASAVGQKLSTLFPTNLTLSYSFRFARRWDASVHLNAQGYVYSRKQYPEKGNSYNWKGVPEWSKVEYEHHAYFVGASVKYIWRENERWMGYSNLGLGVSRMAYPILLYPQLTPVGFHYKWNHWYMVGELSLSFAGTGILVGGGWRF